MRWSVHGYPDSKFPHLILANEDGLWDYQETYTFADLWPPDYPDPEELPTFKDARAIGIFSSPGAIEQDFGSRAAWESPHDPVTSYDTAPE